MRDKKVFTKFGLISAVLILCLFFSRPVRADSYRQQKAHVHGIAHLNMALENNDLYIEFESPAADIVGFEHTPETEKEKSSLQKALGILRVGERMFKFSPDAGVRLEKSVVKTVIHHDCEHEHEHNDHGEDANGQHSDILMEYRFHCKTPDKLKFIDVVLFKRFKSLQKIKVQLLTQTKQTALELTPENTKILF